MGTRSLTRVFEGDTEFTCMYRQYDGYPSGHGAELAEFLNGTKIINKISFGDRKTRVFNGTGCLAAQLVAHFKTEPGGIYLYPPKTRDCWEEFEYHVVVSGPGEEVLIKVYEVSGKKKTLMFSGTPKELMSFCAQEA